MHCGQKLWREFSQFADSRPRCRPDTGCAEHVFGSHCRSNNVGLCKRRWIAKMREQISTKQGLRRLLENHAGVPAVRNMRRIDPANALASKIEDLAIGERARRTVGEVVERHHAGGLPLDHLRLRRARQP